MIVKVMDSVTGEIRESKGISSNQWWHGNWSCDCNRELMFGIDSEGDVCLGSERFIVIDCKIEDSEDYELSIFEINEYYDKELILKCIEKAKEIK